MNFSPHCVNCDHLADYFLHGSWVCTQCYPFRGWHGKRATAQRTKRREAYFARIFHNDSYDRF